MTRRALAGLSITALAIAGLLGAGPTRADDVKRVAPAAASLAAPPA